MNAARRDSDCLPLPPTPISNALPLGLSKILLILKLKSSNKIYNLRELYENYRQMCSMASSNNTKSAAATKSLYSKSASCRS